MKQLAASDGKQLRSCMDVSFRPLWKRFVSCHSQFLFCPPWIHGGSVMLKPLLRCLVWRFAGNVVCSWSVPMQQSTEASCCLFFVVVWNVGRWLYRGRFQIGASDCIFKRLSFDDWKLRSANIGAGPFTTTTTTSGSTTTSVASNELPLGSHGTMVRWMVLCAFFVSISARSSHWNQCAHVCRGQWW